MKLFREDLKVGLNHRLFEINTESPGFHDILSGSKVSCLLSSDIINQGFRVTGTLNAELIETCDRCLKEYSEHVISHLKLILTSKSDYFNGDENVVWFPESEEFIDMKNIVKDLILLEIPMKTICSPDCKGLCWKCGCDLNQSTCNCD